VQTILILAAILGAALGCGATSGDPAIEAHEHCVELRDHMVDLRLKDAVDGDVDVAAHRAAMKQALGDHFVDSCLKSLSEKQLHCVMTATDSQSASDCTSSN
jgi:hypothetical protein